MNHVPPILRNRLLRDARAGYRRSNIKQVPLGAAFDLYYATRVLRSCPERTSGSEPGREECSPQQSPLPAGHDFFFVNFRAVAQDLVADFVRSRMDTPTPS